MSTLAELIDLARSFHRNGRLQDAETASRNVLATDPASVDGLYLLGTACHGLGKLQDAEQNLAEAVRLKPDFAAAHHHRAVVLAQQGKFDQAEASYRRSLELQPNDARAYNNLGVALLSSDRLDEAEQAFRRALELKPDYAEALINHAMILANQGRQEEAAAGYRRALALKPDNFEAYNNLGISLEILGNFAEAEASYARAVQLNPAFPVAFKNLGALLSNQEKLDDAETCFRRALVLDPLDAPAHKGLAVVLARQEKYDEAAASHLRSLELAEDDPETHNHLGLVRMAQADPTAAEGCYQRAIAHDAEYAEAHFNLGVARLMQGQFAEGWPEYEWRWTNRELEKVMSKPRWNGAKRPKSTLLLQSEQGLGDTLQFVRYARQVSERVGSVVVECLPQLARLIATCPGVDAVVARGEELPKFGLYAPLLSLPGIFETRLETIPAEVPYLQPPEAEVAAWRQELAGERRLKIGIAWRGSPDNKSDRFRSFAAAQFAGLARREGVCLYSLQFGGTAEELAPLGPGVVDLGPRLGDLASTAAIMRNLDLVITCDSAPAHLAGAIGVRAWVALAQVSDWRWLLDRDDSPWYPTLRLFRQTQRGDWDGVFARIERAVAELG